MHDGGDEENQLDYVIEFKSRKSATRILVTSPTPSAQRATLDFQQLWLCLYFLIYYRFNTSPVLGFWVPGWHVNSQHPACIMIFSGAPMVSALHGSACIIIFSGAPTVSTLHAS